MNRRLYNQSFVETAIYRVFVMIYSEAVSQKIKFDISEVILKMVGCDSKYLFRMESVQGNF